MLQSWGHRSRQCGVFNVVFCSQRGRNQPEILWNAIIKLFQGFSNDSLAFCQFLMLGGVRVYVQSSEQSHRQHGPALIPELLSQHKHSPDAFHIKQCPTSFHHSALNISTSSVYNNSLVTTRVSFTVLKVSPWLNSDLITHLIRCNIDTTQAYNFSPV